jgi:hypothetical protein
MKVTRLGRTRPSVGIGAITGGAGGAAGTGLVSTGSNSGTEWRQIVYAVSADGNPVNGPFVNLAAGSNITLTRDSGPGGSMPSNTIRIHSTGGGGSSLTVADEGVDLSTAATKLDFVGAGVTASGTGATKTITIPGGGSGGDLTFITETVLGSAAANITITGIPNTYRDLVVVIQARGSTSADIDNLYIRVGDGSIDTGGNYSYATNSVGSGSGLFGSVTQSEVLIGTVPDASSTAGAFGSCELTIEGYANTSRFKGILGRSYHAGASTHYRVESGGVWRNAAAELDQIRVYASGGNLATGSRVTVYGRT